MAAETTNMFDMCDDSARGVFLLMQDLSAHMVLSFQLVIAFCYVLNIYREAIKNSKNPDLEHLKPLCLNANVFVAYCKKHVRLFVDYREFR